MKSYFMTEKINLLFLRQEQIYERLTDGRLKPLICIIGTHDVFHLNRPSIYLKRIICLP